MLRCFKFYNKSNNDVIFKYTPLFLKSFIPSPLAVSRSFSDSNNNNNYSVDYEWNTSFKANSLNRKKTSILTGEERGKKKDTADLSILNKYGLLKKGVAITSNNHIQEDENLTNIEKKRRRKRTSINRDELSIDQEDNDVKVLNSSEYNDTIEYHPSMLNNNSNNITETTTTTTSGKVKKTKNKKSSTLEQINNDISELSQTDVEKPKRKRKSKKDLIGDFGKESNNNKDDNQVIESDEVVMHPSMSNESKIKRKSKKSSNRDQDQQQIIDPSILSSSLDGVVSHDVNWLVNNQLTMIDSPLDNVVIDSNNDLVQQHQQQPKKTPKPPKRVVHKPIDEAAEKRFKEWLSFRQQLLESVPTQVDLPDLPEEPLTVTAETAEQSILNQRFPWDKFVDGCNQLVFGNDKLRLLQLEAINSVLYRRDTFVSLPTGGGKSLCFQLPAIVDSGLTLVVSPLLALMFDQVSKLLQLGVPTVSLNSSVPISEKKKIINELLNPSGCPYKLLYVTPERLKTQEFIDILTHLNNTSQLKRLVIDEAHCISEWGHDFRKDYRKLSKFRELFPNIPIVALTATATPRVELDIKQQLSMHNTINIRGSFVRSNLKYQVRKKNIEQEFCFNDIYQFINRNHKNSSGIIYCSTTAECEILSEYLSDRDLSVDYYHASLNATTRVDTQQRWINGNVKIICTTIAFGMGIDKPDTRFVIHHTIPSSIESYYQQTGRAGRDGKLSDCILYYNKHDIKKITKISTMSIIAATHEEYQKISTKKIENIDTVTSYCVGSECRRVSLMEYFGEETKPCKTMCDNCQLPKNSKYFEDEDNDEHERIYTSRFNYGTTKKSKSKSKSKRFVSIEEDEDDEDNSD